MLKNIGEKIVASVPLRWQNTARQFLKFGVTGTIGAIVDFGTYNLLVRGMGFTAMYVVSGQQIIVANNVSVLLAIVSNFILNKYWTFRDKSEKVMRQWTAYFVLNFITWVLNQLLVSYFAFRVVFIENAAGDQKDNVAKVLAIGIILFLNFLGSKFLIFKRQPVPAKVEKVGPTTPIG